MVNFVSALGFLTYTSIQGYMLFFYSFVNVDQGPLGLPGRPGDPGEKGDSGVPGQSVSI